jgi:hypothetical protein
MLSKRGSDILLVSVKCNAMIRYIKWRIVRYEGGHDRLIGVLTVSSSTAGNNSSLKGCAFLLMSELKER